MELIFDSFIQNENEKYLIKIPNNYLQNVKIRPVKGTINELIFKGWLVNINDSFYIQISKNWIEDNKHIVGILVEVNFRIIEIGLPKQKVPKELLSKLSENNIDLDILPDYEKQQLFSSVVESKTEEIRKKRIDAIISACILKQQRINGK